MHVTTVGLDLAKHVFQIHGIDQDGQVLIRRQLRRGELIGFFRRLPPCLIGMEACSTAHFWARELAVLGHISKQGDRYLRQPLGLGATTLSRYACGKTSVKAGWINALLARIA